jgi:hypothetical protein
MAPLEAVFRRLPTLFKSCIRICKADRVAVIYTRQPRYILMIRLLIVITLAHALAARSIALEPSSRWPPERRVSKGM